MFFQYSTVVNPTTANNADNLRPHNLFTLFLPDVRSTHQSHLQQENIKQQIHPTKTQIRNKMIDRTIFESLQSKIDEEAAVRDVRAKPFSVRAPEKSQSDVFQELHEIVQTLARNGPSLSMLQNFCFP